MWKIFVGFIAFALVALFVVMKGGDKIDMQGESSQGSAEHASSPGSTAASAAPATSAAPNKSPLLQYQRPHGWPHAAFLLPSAQAAAKAF
jgi:hypothetical protein